MRPPPPPRSSHSKHADRLAAGNPYATAIQRDPALAQYAQRNGLQTGPVPYPTDQNGNEKKEKTSIPWLIPMLAVVGLLYYGGIFFLAIFGILSPYLGNHTYPTNTPLLTQANSNASQTLSMPVNLSVGGYSDLTNGIAVKGDSASACQVYPGGCFRFDYSQYNNTCPNGITLSITLYDKNDQLLGTMSQSGGNSLGTPSAIEFGKSTSVGTAASYQPVSVSCASLQ